MKEWIPGVWVRHPAVLRPLGDFRLIAFDMDATLVAIETLDVLAQAAGQGEVVAAMTEAVMQGHPIDYEQSLRQRVALLAGLPASTVGAVLAQHLRLNPGVPRLVAACKAAGLYCMLITGGFTCFAEPLARQLGLDAVRANVLEMQDGHITGTLLTQPGQPLVDAAGKKQALLQACVALGVDSAQAIAMGDGANDLQMLAAAGLGVGYHPKPVVRAQADVVIAQGGVDRLLDVLG